MRGDREGAKGFFHETKLRATALNAVEEMNLRREEVEKKKRKR
jgi:hypothetical protein